jgi:hypothetical protein
MDEQKDLRSETRKPDEVLVTHIDKLFATALHLHHPIITELISKTPAGRASDLREALRIGRDAYSRWKSGKWKKPVSGKASNPVTDRLIKLLTRERYIEQHGTQALAYAIFDYWSQLADPKLSQIVLLLREHEAKLVRIARREADAENKSRDMELAEAANAVWARKSSTPALVLRAAPDRLPLRLITAQTVEYRQAEVERLEAFMSDTGANALIRVQGHPEVGKSQMLKLFAATATQQGHPAHEATILHVDLSHAKNRQPSRAFYNALKRGGATFEGGAAGAEEYDDDEELLQTDVQLLADLLPRREMAPTFVVIMESYSEIAHEERAGEQLKAILAHQVFRKAFNILEHRQERLPFGRPLPALAVEPFSEEEAIPFLVSKGQEEGTVRAAIEQTRLHAYLRAPGILMRGASAYSPHLRRSCDSGPSADDLFVAWMEEARDIAAGLFDRICNADEGDTSLTATSLLAAAVLAEVPPEPGLLQRAKLAALPSDLLLRLGWLEEGPEGRLIGFGRVGLRAVAEWRLKEEEANADSACPLGSAVLRLCREALLDPDAPAGFLDEAIGWLSGRLPGIDLVARLETLLARGAVADQIFPFTPAEAGAAAGRFWEAANRGDFDAALAAAAVCARGTTSSPAKPLHSAQEFLRAAWRVAELATALGALSWPQLQSFDSALYFGSRRHRLFREVLAIRNSLLPVLERQTRSSEVQSLPWRLAWLSFILNVADMRLGLDDAAGVESIVKNAEVLLRTLAPQDYRRNWLAARIWLLKERMAIGAAQRLAALNAARESAADCLMQSSADTRWARFYLRIVNRLVRELHEDQDRAATVDEAKQRLEAVFGNPGDWAVGIKAQFAALMRHEARRAWREQYQKQRAGQALSLLRSGNEEELAQDPQACLVEARLLAFLGRRKQALQSCQRAMDFAPTASSWLLKLRLLDGDRGGHEDWGKLSGSIEDSRDPLPPSLAKEMTELRKYALSKDGQGAFLGPVLLWADQRMWRAQGSIQRYASSRLRDLEQRDFGRLPRDEKIERLTQTYQQRVNRINKLEKRFGKSIGLFITRFRNEAQYCRSIAVVNMVDTDIERPLGVLEEGFKWSPDSHILLYYKAEYLRYVWKYEAAAEMFRTLTHSASSGDLRRNASWALARTLYSGAVFSTAESKDPAARAAELKEAQTLVEDLVGSAEMDDDVPVLRDLIKLEMGEAVDWAGLERTYDKCVARIYGFPNVLLDNLSEVARVADHRPTSVAEAVLENFGDARTMGLAGMLYLRKAERRQGNNSTIEDLRKAVALFQAEALLERSRNGSELPTTSFRIASTILLGAEIEENTNPISGLKPEGKEDQLSFAEAKFSRVVSCTTGEFRDTARKQQSRASKLRAILRLTHAKFLTC